MKKYAKPQMMAKNAPTGSYAAGCPTYNSQKGQGSSNAGPGHPLTRDCRACEVAK
jgi:hypothetical protein